MPQTLEPAQSHTQCLVSREIHPVFLWLHARYTTLCSGAAGNQAGSLWTLLHLHHLVTSLYMKPNRAHTAPAAAGSSSWCSCTGVQHWWAWASAQPSTALTDQWACCIYIQSWNEGRTRWQPWICKLKAAPRQTCWPSWLMCTNQLRRNQKCWSQVQIPHLHFFSYLIDWISR